VLSDWPYPGKIGRIRKFSFHKESVVTRSHFLVLALIASGSAWGSCTLPADHQSYVDIVACGASTSNSDNQSYINAALTAATGQYPGIYVPPGTFATSGDHIPSAGVGIYGSGTLQLTASSSSPIIDTAYAGNTISGLSFDLSKSTAASRVAVDIDGGSSGTVVSNVTVNFGRIIAYVTNGGSAPTQIQIRHNTLASAITGGTSGGAIDIDSGTSHFAVVGNIVNGDWNGLSPVQTAGNGAGISVETGSTYGEVTSNDTYANTGSGIYLLSGYYISVASNNCSLNQQSGIGVNSANAPRPGRLSITANTCNQNVYDGIDINEASGTNFIYITVQGNYLASNGPPPGGGGTGINLDYAANVAITSNTIFSNAYTGILLNSSQNIAVTGNLVANNSTSAVGTNPGIYLVSSTYNAFTGNICTNNGGTASQSYGIAESSSASDWNTYTGNNDQDNVSGTLHILGTHDVQSGNL
jgi:parallel beta-helix repeat protein